MTMFDKLSKFTAPGPGDIDQLQRGGEVMAARLTAMLTSFSIGTEPFHEAVAGYKAQLMNVGMSEEAAEAGAMNYHSMLLAVFLDQIIST